MQVTDKLLANNKEWAKRKKEENPHYFHPLKEGQSPEVLLLACSDSRVSPSTVLGTDLGELFVHRNIANVVAHGDLNFLSVLQYSVEVLKVKHIIVNGHYGCGGIHAAMSEKNYGLIENWLSNIVNVMKLNKTELAGISDENDKFDRIVELNVLEQIENIKHTSVYKKALAAGVAPRIHGWVFDFGTGDIKVLI